MAGWRCKRFTICKSSHPHHSRLAVFVTLLSRRDHHLSCHLGRVNEKPFTYCSYEPRYIQMSYKSVCEWCNSIHVVVEIRGLPAYLGWFSCISIYALYPLQFSLGLHHLRTLAYSMVGWSIIRYHTVTVTASSPVTQLDGRRWKDITHLLRLMYSHHASDGFGRYPLHLIFPHVS